MRDGLNDRRRDDDLHMTAGALLNKVARAVNPFSFGRPGGYDQYAIQGHQAGGSSSAPMIIGIAVITSIDDTCADATTEKELANDPCRSKFLYTCRLRYYDFEEGKWREYDEERPLDVGWARGLSAEFNVDMPIIPPFKVGDLVVVGYDEQRGQLVPIFKPAPMLIARTPSSGLPGRCGVEVCMEDVTIYEVDNDLDPSSSGCFNVKPHLDENGAQVTRKCANLDVEDIPGDCLILISQEGITGTYFAMGSSSTTKLHKGRSRGCHNPGGIMVYDLLQYSSVTEEWEFTGRRVNVQDPHFANFVLPGEIIWIIQGDGVTGGCGINECPAEENPESPGQQRPWFTLGSFGLLRMAQATQRIDCGSFGDVEVFFHQSQDTCSKTDSTCIVNACNDWGFPKIISKDEEVKVKFFERNWQIINEPAANMALATLIADLCPDDAIAAVGVVRFMDRCSNEAVVVVDNSLGLSGNSGDFLVIARDQDGPLSDWMALNVQHKCRTIVAKGCDDDDNTKVITLDGCEIKAFILDQTSIMSCVDAVETTQVTFPTQTVVTNVSLDDGTTSASGAGECDLVIQKIQICAPQPSGAEPFDNTIPFKAEVVVTDVRQDGEGCIEFRLKTLFVPCSEDAVWVQPIDCIQCTDAGSC